ncbi:MAG TPA: DUF2914 domain-containing protein [Kofleriaceae bacterium]|nr:DUF2914 domain-containing protein [Kofleriaceae bacterium]
MRTTIASIATSIVLALSGVAAAQPQTQPAKPASPSEPTAAAAEVKAAKKVENREPVDEGASFAKGETVWIWSRVTGASGTTVKHVWKRDGKDVWTATLKIGSNKWTTSSRRTMSTPGSYAVDVVGADGAILGSVSFTVQ